MKNNLKFITALSLAVIYLFVLSSVNAKGFNINSHNGKQTISVSLSSQLFSHSIEKGNSINDIPQYNSSFKDNLSTAYLDFNSIEFVFNQQLSLFNKRNLNYQESYQRLKRLFPFHYFL